MDDRLLIFEKELKFIQNEEIKEEAKKLIRLLPDYFFSVAASSTGKYHPDYALGNGGLVRHTQAAVRIANELFRLDIFRGLSEKKDYIFTALLLHDGLKHGKAENRWTVAEHPVLAAEFVKENCELEEMANEVSSLIETHMGQWNTDYKSGREIMPKPSTKAQSFVHLCDYLASRKCLEFNFEAE